MSKEFWCCDVGPIERDRLPDGADLPMRNAVAEAFHRLTGEWPSKISSGWGNETGMFDQVCSLKKQLTQSTQEPSGLVERTAKIREYAELVRDTCWLNGRRYTLVHHEIPWMCGTLLSLATENSSLQTRLEESEERVRELKREKAKAWMPASAGNYVDVITRAHGW